MKVPFLNWFRRKESRTPLPPVSSGGARAFEAAVTTNLNVDFVASYGSGNADVLSSIFTVKGRSRTLSKDFSTVTGAIRTFKNQVVGDNPFPLSMQVGTWSADGKTFTLDTKTNRMIEEAWEEAGNEENCTVRRDMSRMEVCQLIEASMLRDGSVLLRHRRGFPHNPFSYAIEVIDSSRLQENYMGKTVGGNAMRFSIERDEWNAPVAYHILKRNPGDLFMTNAPGSQGVFRERVPADEIMHVNDLIDFPEQDLAMPAFTNAMLPLHLMRQFDLAHRTAAVSSASKLGWIKKDYPTGMQMPGDPSTTLNWQLDSSSLNSPMGQGDQFGRGNNKVENVQPGSWQRLDIGETPVLSDPRFPVESAAGFKRDNMHDVANATGLSYAAVSADFEKLSFSVARSSEMPQRDYWKVRQKHHKNKYYRKWFAEWLKYALLTQALPLPFARYDEFVRAAKFGGKVWASIQPREDAETAIMEIEAGLKSPQEVAANRGVSLEQVYQEIAEAKAMAENHGLDFSSVEVTEPQIAKGSPDQPDPKASPLVE